MSINRNKPISELSGGKWEDGLALAFASSFAIIIFVYYAFSVLIGGYEHQSHNPNEYIDSGEHRKVMLGYFDTCAAHKIYTPEKEGYCKDTKKEILALMGVSDLAAQQTMATATRGVLYASWFQIVVGALTVLLVGVTLMFTRNMLEQTSETLRASQDALRFTEGSLKHSEETASQAALATGAANDAHKETKRANALLLRPFIRVVNPRIAGPNWNYKEVIKPTSLRLQVSVNVNNFGKTVARNVSQITTTHGKLLLFERSKELNVVPIQFAWRNSDLRDEHAITLINPEDTVSVRIRLHFDCVEGCQDISQYHNTSDRLEERYWVMFSVFGFMDFEDMETGFGEKTSGFRRCSFAISKNIVGGELAFETGPRAGQELHSRVTDDEYLKLQSPQQN